MLKISQITIKDNILPLEDLINDKIPAYLVISYNSSEIHFIPLKNAELGRIKQVLNNGGAIILVENYMEDN